MIHYHSYREHLRSGGCSVSFSYYMSGSHVSRSRSYFAESADLTLDLLESQIILDQTSILFNVRLGRRRYHGTYLASHFNFVEYNMHCFSTVAVLRIEQLITIS